MRAFAMLGLACLVTLPAVPAHGTDSAHRNRISYVSKPGDPIGVGRSEVLTENLEGTGGGNNWRFDYVGVHGSTNDSWYNIGFRAPQGKPLEPGLYTEAVNWEQDPDRPGMHFGVTGRDCYESTGAFEIIEMKRGPFGYLEHLHAKFRYKCDGASAGSYGEVVFRNPPPPPVARVRMVWNKRAILEADGSLTLRATYTCNKDASMAVAGRVRQRMSVTTKIDGQFGQTPYAPCTPVSRTWTQRIERRHCSATMRPGPARFMVTTATHDRFFPGTSRKTKVLDLVIVRR